MTDPYLIPNKSYYRLIKDYETHNSLVVAFDFDNTVFDYHEYGCEYKKIINLLRRCKFAGFFLICFTANQDEISIAHFLNRNNIPFDYINQNPPFFKADTKKVYYNILLDDRAELIQAYT